MLPYIDVLNRLDHKCFHSGQDLANDFSVTRATIHNCILRIEAIGIPIERVRGKGYKLFSPLDLLSKEIICANLSASVSSKLSSFVIEQVITSTNEYIAKIELPKQTYFSVVLAEMQTAGRGRRGRTWQSPYAANVYMSVLWNLQKPLSEVGALSPLLAISIVRALEELGVIGLGLKWPNDIHCDNKKLAGLLIECSGEMGGQTKMIIGVGVNVHMSKQGNINIDQQWTDITSATSNSGVSRNQVVAGLLNQVIPTLKQFDLSTSDALTEDWAQWDVMKDKAVILSAANENITGVARGIDEGGRLLLENENGLQAISAGDVSLRANS